MAYTADPVTYDHVLIIGDSYQPATVTLTDSAGAAHSLVGATGVCQLRSEPLGELLLTATVTVTDGAGGVFTWSAAAATTAALLPGKARYSLRMTFADASVRTVLVGTVTLRRETVS